MKTAEKSASKYVLFIDTASEETFVAIFKGSAILDSNKWNGGNVLSETLLVNIEKLLKNSKITLQDLEKIAVFSGPGSYTGLRIGVTTANFLGWTLEIPVADSKVINGKLLTNKIFTKKTILPKYLNRPQITQSKKDKIASLDI